MAVNRDLVEDRLTFIAKCVKALERLAAVDRAAFVSDDVRAAAAESYLRRSLEAVFDIGRHLVAKSGFRRLASEHKSIAKGLVEIGAVGGELGEKLVDMAGYRNRLVHLYDEVTADELYSILSSELEDFRRFVRAIRDYLA